MHSKINQVITGLNLAKARRVSLFYVNFNRNTFMFLNKLSEYGIIRGFHIEDLKIKVLMKYLDNRVVFNKIYFIKGKRYVKLINLLKMANRIQPSLYLLITSQGYKFHDECILNGISGRVIARIDL